MWSSNIKVLLEQSHTDCFLTSFKKFFFYFFAFSLQIELFDELQDTIWLRRPKIFTVQAIPERTLLIPV